MKELFFVDIDADTRNGEVETAAGDGVLSEVAGEFAIVYVHVVWPLDEDVRHVFGEEPSGGGGEPEVEDELIGGIQPCLEVDAGEDVASARTVPFVAARPTPRRLKVSVHGVEVRKRVAVMATVSRQGREPDVGRFYFF